MSSWNKHLGDYGELLAEQFYLEHGYIILRQNFRYNRAELDLVVQKCNVVVVVEVKTRSYSLESAAEALNEFKRNQMARAVEGLIEELDAHVEIRFDLVAYCVRKEETVYQWMKDVYW